MAAQTVSYDSAMASLHSMFSGVDNEVIAMLLQANNGHLERTVEQLLGITGGALPGDSSIPTNSSPAGAAAAGAGTQSGLSVPSSAASRRKSSGASERAAANQSQSQRKQGQSCCLLALLLLSLAA